MLMVYTDLLLLFASCFILYTCIEFALSIKKHITSLRHKSNRIRERIHLYSHIWIVGSGLIAIVLNIILQTAHIYFQDILHDEAAVTQVEMVLNVGTALLFLTYGRALKHFISEETPNTHVCYYRECEAESHDERTK